MNRGGSFLSPKLQRKSPRQGSGRVIRWVELQKSPLQAQTKLHQHTRDVSEMCARGESTVI